MTVSIPAYVEKVWQGDGSTTAFFFQTRVLEAEDIEVSAIDDGVEMIYALGNYSLTGLGSPSGVTISFATAPAATRQVRARRLTAPKQTVNYTDTGKVPGATTEQQLDRITMALQDHRNLLTGLDLVATLDAALRAEVAADRAEDALEDALAMIVPDSSVSETKLSASVRNTLNVLGGFAYKTDVQSATIPSSVTRAYMPRAGAELVAIGTPSPVKPWHVQSDNGRYFEMRFPDGRVDLRAWAGSNQGVDASTNDGALLKYAAEYIDRAWWATAGGAAQGRSQRGCIYVPPGLWTIDPADPLIGYDYMRLIGAGDGQSMIAAFSTGPGALVQRPAAANYNSGQRTTRVEVRGIRFIATGNSQTMLDLAHCGRLRITENQFCRQDRVDDWNNAKQSALPGTVGIRLRNSDTVLVGGDIVEIDHNHIYWMDNGILSGAGAGAPGPESTYIGHNEISDCSLPILVNNYGGAGGTIEHNQIQRWKSTERAIDIAGRRWDVGKNYLETAGNSVPPILFRTGSEDCNIARKKITNYTDHVSVSVISLGVNDGTNTRDEYGTVLGAGTFAQ